MYYTYILQSTTAKKYYVGHCADITKRIKDHNHGKVKSTKHGRQWEIVYSEHFPAKNDAYKREQQIKSYKGGNAFQKLLRRGVRVVEGAGLENQ